MSNLNQNSQSELPNTMDPKTAALLKRLNALQNNVHAQFETLAKANGMSTEQFLAYFSNPRNFAPAQWETAQNLRKELMHRFKLTVPSDDRLRKSDLEVAFDARNRKAKLLGARKNWLPVR